MRRGKGLRVKRDDDIPRGGAQGRKQTRHQCLLSTYVQERMANHERLRRSL